MATLSVAADGIAVARSAIGRSGMASAALAEQEPAAGVGGRVADGEFLVGPGAREMAVGLVEVDHFGLAA
jgi:hypothetical protein